MRNLQGFTNGNGQGLPRRVVLRERWKNVHGLASSAVLVSLSVVFLDILQHHGPDVGRIDLIRTLRICHAGPSTGGDVISTFQRFLGVHRGSCKLVVMPVARGILRLVGCWACLVEWRPKPFQRGRNLQ